MGYKCSVSERVYKGIKVQVRKSNWKKRLGKTMLL